VVVVVVVAAAVPCALAINLETHRRAPPPEAHAAEGTHQIFRRSRGGKDFVATLAGDPLSKRIRVHEKKSFTLFRGIRLVWPRKR